MHAQSSISSQREAQLLQQIRRGDRASMAELLTAYHKRIYHLALRMLGNASDAADVTQETMLRAIQHIDGFKGGSRFSTWLCRIAMNQAVTQYRKASREPHLSLDDVGSSKNDDQATALRQILEQSRELSPEQNVQTQEDIEHLQQAIQQIDLPLRSILLLRDLEQMDYQQIADVMSLPIGTVKSRLFRARLALRQAMKHSPRTPNEESPIDHAQ